MQGDDELLCNQGKLTVCLICNQAGYYNLVRNEAVTVSNQFLPSICSQLYTRWLLGLSLETSVHCYTAATMMRVNCSLNEHL